MQKAFMERGPLTDLVLDMEHTNHCLQTLTDRRFPMNDMHTLLHTKWPKCYAQNEWNSARYVDYLNLAET